MKYSIDGFRPVYRNFCLFKATDYIKGLINGQPAWENADSVLTYGYIDHDNGLYLEILACAITTDKGQISFAPVEANKRISFRIDAVMEDEFEFVAYGNDPVREKFMDKISILEKSESDEDLKQSRTFSFLDEFRHEINIDDVYALLTKDGLEPEKCRVRIERLGDQVIIARILGEPGQQFGYHIDDEILLYIEQNAEGKNKLVSDLNPGVKLSREELSDGSMLRAAIAKFNADKSQDSLTEVLELLRDSSVLVPCIAMLSKQDQQALKELVEKSKENGLKENDGDFKNQEKIRLVPDVVKKGDKYFFPVFSADSEMSAVDKRFSKVRKSFIDVIKRAKANNPKIDGIVIDADTNAMVVSSELFETVLKMRSRIVK